MQDAGNIGSDYPRFKTEVNDACSALVRGNDATYSGCRSRAVRTAPVTAVLHPCATCDSTSISVRSNSTGLDPAMDDPVSPRRGPAHRDSVDGAGDGDAD